MRTNRKVLWIALLLVLSIALPAVGGDESGPYFSKIQKDRKLIIGLNASYPPFAYWPVGGGEPTGFDVAFSKALAETLGIEVEYVKVRPDDAADALNSGKVDLVIAGLSATPKRMAKVAFTRPYVTISRAALLNRSKIPQVILDDKLVLKPVYSYTDLAKIQPLRVGAKEGTTNYRAAMHDLTDSVVKGYPDTDSMVEDFMAGRLDVIVHEDPFVRYFAASHESKRNRFVALTRPVNSEGLAVALRYGDPDFARFLDTFIGYLKDSGKLAAWESLYFDTDTWKGGAK